MRDFEASTLWRVSEFERERLRTGTSGFTRLDGPSILPSTLQADLRRLNDGAAGADVLEVIAACMRHREPALLCLRCDGLVWPVTLFPSQRVYHAPCALQEGAAALAELRLLSTEPAGVHPPGRWQDQDSVHLQYYHPLAPLLWTLSLYGPRPTLLQEIAGTAAYRALSVPAEDGVTVSGALGSAATRLRRETASLRTISGWPGMSTERASRLLNGLYLSSSLMASRAHPAARSEPRAWRDIIRGHSPQR
jgi:hypothetical protein